LDRMNGTENLMALAEYERLEQEAPHVLQELAEEAGQYADEGFEDSYDVEDEEDESGFRHPGYVSYDEDGYVTEISEGEEAQESDHK
jgi:hypothetical protein